MTDVDVTDARADGIAIEAAHAVSVTGARLRRIGGAAVSIEGESRRVRIADSSIEDSGVGIRDRGGGLSLITGNTIARTRIGIAIAAAPLERVIEGNIIVNAVEGDVVMLDADGRPRASGASGLERPAERRVEGFGRRDPAGLDPVPVADRGCDERAQIRITVSRSAAAITAATMTSAARIAPSSHLSAMPRPRSAGSRRTRLPRRS